jgi:hypothetical protein
LYEGAGLSATAYGVFDSVRFGSGGTCFFLSAVFTARNLQVQYPKSAIMRSPPTTPIPILALVPVGNDDAGFRDAAGGVEGLLVVDVDVAVELVEGDAEGDVGVEVSDDVLLDVDDCVDAVLLGDTVATATNLVLATFQVAETKDGCGRRLKRLEILSQQNETIAAK